MIGETDSYKRIVDFIHKKKSVSKKDILEYLNLNSLNFVQDDSNFDTNFTRNFIRLELLPKLQKLNPKFNNAVSKLSPKYVPPAVTIDVGYLAYMCSNV